MIRSLARVLTRMDGWLAPSPGCSMPGIMAPGRSRGPTTSDLLAELHSTAWTCASLNAAVCAAKRHASMSPRAGASPPRDA